MTRTDARPWRPISFLLEAVFFLFILSFFLKLGSDILEQPALRIAYLVFLTPGLLILFSRRERAGGSKSPTIIFLLLFLGFEAARLGWAVWQMAGRGIEDSLMLPLHRYLASPMTWILYAGFFFISYLQFRDRSTSHRLLWLLAWGGFFLAVAAIPPLLLRGQAAYPWPSGRTSFFPHFFYFHKVVGKYFLSTYANPNYVGDIVAIGFFAALGIFLYLLQQRAKPHSLFLSGLFVATEALAVILFFSRATIICFAVSFILFLLISLIKFPSRTQSIFAGLALLLVFGFFIWAGNVQKTVKELQTVQRELDKSRPTSFSDNREGAKRALAIYDTFTLWGVGTRGYQSVSEFYATPELTVTPLSHFKALCHYLQTLAEEGTGAFLYFGFLIAFLLESLWRLFRVESRFQFMAALALFMPVIMILAHAAVKPVMDYFAVATPVYLLMGAALGVLSRDFEHA